jgi:tetratricopeptide (TPR) repeat protein
VDGDDAARWQELADAYQPHLPHVTLQVGDSIAGDYQVQAILGTTILTVTYLAYSTSRKTYVVVKTLRNAYLRDPAARKRFRRAAEAWIKLGSHPYAVGALGLSVAQPRVYLILEYIAPDGHGLNSLQSYLERRRLSVVQALTWGIQICWAMERAATAGIRAHGDLKPANVLIDRDGVARVTDFGLASVLGVASAVPQVKLSVHDGRVRLSRQKIERTGYGTPTHMAPEQFHDANAGDQRADVYSFGVLLFQMVAGGRLPFWSPLPDRPDDDQAVRLRAEMGFWRDMERLHATAPPPPIDGPVGDVIQRCLAKAPGDRYRSFLDLRRDLEHVVAIVEPRASVAAPDAFRAGRDLHGEALGLMRQELWQDALATLDEVMRADPGRVRAAVDRAACLRHLGRFDEALSALDALIALDPGLVDLAIERGLSLRAVGRFAEAADAFADAVQRGPECAAAWLSRGIAMNDLGRPADALRFFDRAQDLDPTIKGAWFSRAASLYQLNRFDEANQCYERALGESPDHIETLFYNGVSLLRAGRPRDAIASVDRALAADPTLVEGWNNKGLMLRSLGRAEESLSCFDRALELDPAVAEIWANRAMALADLGRHEEAVSDFDEALRRDPAIPSAEVGRGLSLAAFDWHEAALRCYERAIELEPWSGLAWNARGLALNALGRWDEAASSLEIALGIDPTFAAVWNNRGVSLSCLGRTGEALDCFVRASEADPQLASAWANRAASLAELGRLDEAHQCYRRATELQPTSPRVWLGRAETAQRLGLDVEAAEAYRRHIALASLTDDDVSHIYVARGGHSSCAS